MIMGQRATRSVAPTGPGRAGRCLQRGRHGLAHTLWVFVPFAGVGAPSTVRAQNLPPKVVEFLQTRARFTPQEITTANSGNPVVETMSDSDSREIAIVGVIVVNARRSLVVAQVTDSLATRPDPARLGFGIFSDPAVLTDVATLRLPHDDVQDIAKCRPGSCKLKLPAQSISELQTTVDPKSPSADSAAKAFAARAMVAYITAYRAEGKRALVVYDDEAHPIASADVWAAILSRSPYMYEYAPTLERYLVNYPQDRPANAPDTFFWALDDMPGAKPILSMIHEVVYEPPELPGTTLIARQLLYSDHFLDGGLDLTTVIDRSAGGGAPSDSAGVALLVLRRMHFDELPSGGIINVRGRVIGKTRDRTETFLRDTKRRTEAAYAARPAGSS